MVLTFRVVLNIHVYSTKAEIGLYRLSNKVLSIHHLKVMQYTQILSTSKLEIDPFRGFQSQF